VLAREPCIARDLIVSAAKPMFLAGRGELHAYRGIGVIQANLAREARLAWNGGAAAAALLARKGALRARSCGARNGAVDLALEASVALETRAAAARAARFALKAREVLRATIGLVPIRAARHDACSRDKNQAEKNRRAHRHPPKASKKPD
jgi:hypothetical protein